MASTRFGNKGVAIERLDVSAYTVPTDSSESEQSTQFKDQSMCCHKFI